MCYEDPAGGWTSREQNSSSIGASRLCGRVRNGSSRFAVWPDQCVWYMKSMAISHREGAASKLIERFKKELFSVAYI